MRALRTAWVVCARELGGYFASPVAYVVGVLFLALQGLSFWALVQVLSDPREPAPYGAVLSTYFGGTVLYWAVMFALIAALTMHLGAEEKRRGTWELLFSAGASEAGIIAGKHAAAVIVYAVLWLPTTAYLIVLDRFAPPGAGFELGPVGGAYLGVVLIGAAICALGLAASAATSRQIVAALVTFSVAMLGLVAGELGDLGGGASGVAPLAARHHMGELASGLIRVEVVISYAGATVALLLIAHALAAAGRRRSFEVGRRLATAAAFIALAIPLAILGGRIGGDVDLTARRVHSLEAQTTAALERVRRPVAILVIRPAVSGFAAVFRQVDAVLERMKERQPLIEVSDLDPAKVGERVGELAREFAIEPAQLRDGGALVVQSEGRRRLIDVLALAEFDADALGAGALARFDAESELVAAIAAVADERRPTICRTTGAGEVGIEPSPGELDWSAVAGRLRGDGVQLRDIAAPSEIPEVCDAVLVAGPRKPVAAATAAAIDRFVKGGGGLVVAVRSQPPPGASRPPLETGLELVLAERGLGFGPEIVVDPGAEIEGLPYVWRTYDGYGDHPITASLRSRLATLWPAPRRVVIDGGTALVSGSIASWGESDREAVFTGAAVEAGEDEPLARVPVAAASSSARVVAIGSVETGASDFASMGAGHIFCARALLWAAGVSVEVAAIDKRPEQLRLVMTAGQRTLVFAICVVALPLLWALLGIAVALWRRRRG